jgi:hypothetical protein
MREVLLDRADDSGVPGIGQQLKRLPEMECGLQRAAADVQPSRRGPSWQMDVAV